MKKPDWSAGTASNRAQKAVRTASKGKIDINPANKGKFTAYAKGKGESVQQAARSVMADKNASSTLRKRANFARNAASWNKK
jgi:hypothetical protein